jgi:hypothetical protein
MMRRQYLRSRRAYTPRLWPFALLPVALALVLTYIGVRGWVGVVVDFALGLGFAQLRWMIWRRRHPLITTEQWLDEQRRAAPWN